MSLRSKRPSSWGVSAVASEGDLGRIPTVSSIGQTWVWLLALPRDLKPRGFHTDLYSRCDALSINVTQLTFIVTLCGLTLASTTLGHPVFIEHLLCAGTVLDPGKPWKISPCFFPPACAHEQFSSETELCFWVHILALPLVSCKVLGKSHHFPAPAK